jgi:hypothetical protein
MVARIIERFGRLSTRMRQKFCLNINQLLQMSSLRWGHAARR